MIERIRDPQPELRLGEERIVLAEHVQLRVPVKDPRRDKLVKDADDDGWQERELKVVQQECPRFAGDLAEEVAEEGELQDGQTGVRTQKLDKIRSDRMTHAPRAVASKVLCS